MSFTKQDTPEKQPRVRYTDPGTGQEMLTCPCRDLQDAVLKAAMLNGVVVDSVNTAWEILR